MKTLTITAFLVVISLTTSLAQAPVNKITMEKAFGGYRFYSGDRMLTMNQLVSTMESEKKAYEQIKSAKSTYVFANVLAVTGGFLVGWPIGAAIGGGDPNWTMAGIGAGILVVSIPVVQKFNKQVRKAVDTYNSGVEATSFWDRKELHFSIMGSGAGLALRF